MPWLEGLVIGLWREEKGPYKSDVDVDGAVVEEPVHECSFWGHHVGVFLHFLGGLLCCCERRAGISWWIFSESLAVGGRVEFCRFLEHGNLSCCPWFCWSFVRGIADNCSSGGGGSS